jgi:hypothetical protein
VAALTLRESTREKGKLGLECWFWIQISWSEYYKVFLSIPWPSLPRIKRIFLFFSESNLKEDISYAWGLFPHAMIFHLFYWQFKKKLALSLIFIISISSRAPALVLETVGVRGHLEKSSTKTF